MQIINYVLPSDNCNIFLFGDVHTGSMMSHEVGFNRMVDMINSTAFGLKSKYNVCLDHGDMIEAIEVKDKRFCLETTKIASIDKQIEQAITLRKHIRSKLVTCLKGNHEHKINTYTNPAKRICEQLKIPYGTYSAIINYTDEHGLPMFKHYATHGYGSIKSDADDPVRQKSNMQLSLKRKLKNKFGDTLLSSMGHTHKMITVTPEPTLYLTTQGREINQNYTEAKKRIGYIEPNHKFYANCGSFLRMYSIDEEGVDGYAERAGYDPVTLGFVVCLVRNRIPVDLVEVKDI